MMSEKDIQKTIKGILFRYVDPATTAVFLFGSRATGRNDPTADYDVGLFRGEPIEGAVLAQIKADLDESNIPVFVDVVDFARLTDHFKKIALKKTSLWNQPKNGIKIC